MAIRPSAIGTRDIDEAPGMAVQFLVARPILSERFETQHPNPGQLYAYYNAGTGMVELYIISAGGFSYKQVA